jgi:tetratricopeptide (TPR) repeat protein
MLKRLARLFGRPAAAPPAARGAPAPPAEEEPLPKPLRALESGRIDEAVALLQAHLEQHPGSARAHLVLGGILHKRAQSEDARDHFLLASAFAPQWWEAHFELGMVEFEAGRYAEAQAALARALELGGREARVHNALGAAYLNLDKVTEAVEQFRAALVLDPDSAQAHSNLGYAFIRDLEQYDEGARHIERARALDPNDIAVLCNWIMALHHTGRWPEALAIADGLLAQAPDVAEARVNRAIMLLSKGDYARGWADYEARKLSPRNKCGNDVPLPEWDGSVLENRRVFVYPEQGLGDEIMFASCLPDLIERARECTVECHPKLVKLFRRSFAKARILEKGAAGRAEGKAGAAEVKVSIASLPRFFRRSPDEFPARRSYLEADAARVEHWKAKLRTLPGRCKVGISWRGGIASTKRSLRSIPLRDWDALLGLPGIDYVSLQYSDPDHEIEAVNASGGRQVHVWQDAIDDYDETAALVCALDLVVSVQTAVVHLAGGLGRPVWALIPALPEWRYGVEGSAMPWYPSVRLVRQDRPGNWASVLQIVGSELAAWAAPDSK